VKIHLRVSSVSPSNPVATTVIVDVYISCRSCVLAFQLLESLNRYPLSSPLFPKLNFELQQLSSAQLSGRIALASRRAAGVLSAATVQSITSSGGHLWLEGIAADHLSKGVKRYDDVFVLDPCYRSACPLSLARGILYRLKRAYCILNTHCAHYWSRCFRSQQSTRCWLHLAFCLWDGLRSFCERAITSERRFTIKYVESRALWRTVY
jgi:hypothetical protein